MMNLFSKIINVLNSHGSSFSAAYYGEYASSIAQNIGRWFGEILSRLVWSVISLVMSIMDAFEYITFSFLGLDMSLTDFTKVNELVNVDMITRVFRALVGVAIVLMIIFTIIAIVKQEYQNMNSGFTKTDKDGNYQNPNPKMPFVTKIIRNIVLIFAMPILVYISFAGVTSVLNSFNLAIKQNQYSTISGQVLASSTYEANKYRMYANENKRIPIIINAYDSSEANYDNIDDMAMKIASIEVQTSLRDVAKKTATKSFTSFASTLVNKNNSYYNTDTYSKLHEQFICTAEQYQVMADFVDYAQQSGITYYIKSVTDPGVDWKYVSSAVYNQSNNELTIEYVNSSVVNNGYKASAANGKSDETYTIVYTPSANVTTPISDALDSIKAMLGLGEYSDNLYNVLERQEGFTNLVTWANEKAFLKLEGKDGKDFDINDKTTWSDTDEILVYEYYRWSSNNSLRDYTIDDLKEGIEWDVNLITYQEYYDIVDIYSEDRYYYAICLNKNYYIVHKDEKLTDSFGNPYYVLTSHEDEDMTFLSKAYSVVEENGEVNLKLSNSFNINNIDGWTMQDQVLVYEYFNDTNYSNPLRQYNFNQFKSGITLKKYKITNYFANGGSEIINAVILNNTYYKLNTSNLNTSNEIIAATLPNNTFLKMQENNESYVYYYYHLSDNLKTDVESRYGLRYDMDSYVKDGTISDSEKFIDLDLSKENDAKYENFALKLSSNFSYSDISTWSFRDIFVFYLYLSGDGKYGKDISYLKKYGIKGEVGCFDGRYVFKIAGESENNDDTFKYLIISDINAISTEGVYELNIEETKDNNIFSVSNNKVFLTYEENRDKLLPFSGSDANKLETYSYHFEFSNRFREYDKATWTVGDYILVYCSNLGLIGSIDTIKENGYDAVAYSKGVTLDTERYYRFGNDDASALYLRGDNIPLTINSTYEKLDSILKQPLSVVSGYSKPDKADNPETDEDEHLAYLLSDEFSSIWISSEHEIYDTSETTSKVTLKFSEGFEASNYDSWTQADFVLYYMCKTVFGDEKQMQSRINEGVEAEIYNYIDVDYNGSSTTTKVFRINGSNILLNYTAFYKLYDRVLSIYSIKNTNILSYEIKFDDVGNADLKHKVKSSSGLASFVWTDYYYYQVKNNLFDTIKTNLSNVVDEEIQAIENFDTTPIEINFGTINLKLSSGFVLTNPSTWTVLDYIVLTEYSKNIKNNDFEGVSFGNLSTKDNNYEVYNLKVNVRNENQVILAINNTYYNLTKYVKAKDEGSTQYISNNEKMNCLKYSTVGDSFLQVPKETVSFTINPQIKYTIPNTNEFTAVYQTSEGKSVYITPHEGLKIAYQVNLDLLDRYDVAPLVLKVSWPQKLMNDMMVMYPDLNWNTLLAEGNWVDVLGDYNSAFTNGAFVSEGNSSNITAVGLVLAEFFLSAADKSLLGYAEYEYSSTFDQEIINSLMLSLLGEDSYRQLRMQAEIFMDLFNTTFAPMLDDIAREYSVDIANGDTIAISTYVYKAFLATQLLSSDLGEYLYTVANRVYAQYTIYEALASAAGKYVEYQNYVNGNKQSLILRIGTEYYDISGYAEKNKIYDILKFSLLGSKEDYLILENSNDIIQVQQAVTNINNKYKLVRNNVVSLILDTENPDDQLIINKIISSHKVKIKKSNTLKFTILDAIIDYECTLDSSSKGDFNGDEEDLEYTGDGVEVDAFLSESHVFLRVNGKYYDITDFVEVNGDYNLDYSYDDYVDSLYKENTSKIENILDYLFGEMPFAPSSYALTTAISQGKGDYLLKVGYNLDGKDNTKTVLDFIIEKYLDKNVPLINTGGILSDYKDKLPNGDSIAEQLNKDKKENNDFSYLAEIYVVNNENAFTYSTFKELVYYENQFLKNANATPMYTFNMERVYRAFLEKEKGVRYNDNVWDNLWYLIKLNVPYYNKLTRTEEEIEDEYKSQLKQKYNNSEEYDYIDTNWISIWTAMEESESIFVFKFTKDARENAYREKLEERLLGGNHYTDKLWGYIWTGINIPDIGKKIANDEDKKNRYLNEIKARLEQLHLNPNDYSLNDSEFTKELWNLVGLKDSDKVLADTVYSWDSAYEYVYDKLADVYNQAYMKGDKIADSSPYFCYLFEAYYAIHYDVDSRKEEDPNYLIFYKAFLDGEISRWDILAKENITGSTQHIPKYYEYKSALTWQKLKSAFSMMSIFNPQISFSNEIGQDIINAVNNENTTFIEKIGTTIGEAVENTEIYSTKDFVYDSILKPHDADDIPLLLKDYQNVFEIFEADSLIGKILDTLLGGIDDLAQLFELFDSSSEGNTDSWNAILKLHTSVVNIINELNKVKELFSSGADLATAKTEKGSMVVRYDSGAYFTEEDYDKQIKKLTVFSEELGSYIRLQREMDSAVKSSITFTLAQYGKNYVTDYEFTFENRAYTLSSMASALRLAEYTMGGEFLVQYGIYPAFTSTDFEGIVHDSKVYDPEDGEMKTKLDVWPELREFAANLAAYTAKLYYTTSFTDLAPNNINAVYLTDILIDKSKVEPTETSIEQMILEYLCNEEQELNPQTLCTLLLENTTIISTELDDILLKLENLRNPTEDTIVSDIKITFDDVQKVLSVVKLSKNNVHEAFKSVITYLLMSEEQQYEDEDGIHFENMTFSDLKILIIDRLIDYQANASEQSSENINRYLALLNLISSEIRYYKVNGGVSNYVGTNLKPIDVYEKSNKTSAIVYAGSTNALHYYAADGKSEGSEIWAEFVVSEAAYISMIELADAENIPVEDLVQMEYESIYNRTDGVYDENMGDIFVVCQFDELTNKYVPYMAKNFNTSVADSAYDEYLSTYNHLITTNYYADNGKAYPIVAKGIVTSSGLPTAIRVENGVVKYYRTDITATFDINESAILNTVYSSELTTMNYTTYVEATQYLPFGDTNQMVKFIGDVNIATVLSSDFTAYLLQTDTVYSFNAADDRGGYLILDEFSAHYRFTPQVILLLFLGFIVLFPLLYKFSVSAMRRVLDIIFLVLAYPVIISLNTLKADEGKNSVYSKWIDQMKKAMLSVFGFIIGFNCYYILSTTVLRIDFVNQSTVDSIKTIGGFGFVSINTLNMIIRYLFIIQAVSMVKSAMTMLLPIVTGGSATNALASAIDNKDVGDSVKKVVSDVKDMGKKAIDVINGKALIELKDAAIESVKSMVPGSKIMGSIKEDVQGIASRIKGNKMKKMAMQHGVSEKIASEFGKSFTENEKKRREYKRQNRLNNANKFLDTYCKDYKPQHFSGNEHLWPTIKKSFFELPKIGKDKKDKKEKKPKIKKPKGQK